MLSSHLLRPAVLECTAPLSPLASVSGCSVLGFVLHLAASLCVEENWSELVHVFVFVLAVSEFRYSVFLFADQDHE